MPKILKIGLVAAIACLVVAAPASAQSDTTPPTIVPNGLKASYIRGENVLLAFSCTDPSGIAVCDSVVKLDTSTVGEHTLVVSARDNAGNVGSLTVHYLVVAPPLVLTVEMGSPPRFTPFLLGVAREYAATSTAKLTSTASTSSFSVVDESPDEPGHLVNGAFAIPSPLVMQAASTAGTAAPAGSVSNAPLTLLNYAAPVTGDTATLTYTQHIGSSDVLRTGNYSKTLTFTLSALTP
jgi:hypothetical protein